MDCPKCKKPMQQNHYGVWVCKKCKGAFVPEEKHSGPKSIFGVH